MTNARNIRPKSQESGISIISRIDDIEKKLTFFDNIPEVSSDTNDVNGTALFQQFAFDIQKRMEKLQKAFKGQMKIVQDKVFTQLQGENLRLRESMQNELKKLDNQCCNKFADKAKTKRAFASIDLQLAKLIEVLSVVRDGEEAMFSFKPLNGVS